MMVFSSSDGCYGGMRKGMVNGITVVTEARVLYSVQIYSSGKCFLSRRLLEIIRYQLEDIKYLLLFFLTEEILFNILLFKRRVSF